MEIQKKKEACKHFAIYVGGLAVFVPLLLFTGFHALLHPIATNVNVIMFYIAILAIASVAAPFTAFVMYDEEKNEGLADAILYFAGFIIMILVGYIVYYTGGMSHSIFAFFFFFFPSAIAIAFEASIGLIIVCVTSFFTVSGNLYAEKLSHQATQQPMYETNEYFILYILFVAFHLMAIYFLETTSIKRS